MLTLKAHFDGKAIVPDEPVSLLPNQKLRVTVEALPLDGSSQTFSPHADPSTALMSGPLDERDALHIDPLDAVPTDFVRKPGSGAGEVNFADDFDDTPSQFRDYL